MKKVLILLLLLAFSVNAYHVWADSFWINKAFRFPYKTGNKLSVVLNGGILDTTGIIYNPSTHDMALPYRLFFDQTTASSGIVKLGSANATYFAAGYYPDADSGAYITLNGNTHGIPGLMTLSSGNSGTIDMYSSGAINQHGYGRYYLTTDTIAQLSMSYEGLGTEVTLAAYLQEDYGISHALNLTCGEGADPDVHGVNLGNYFIRFRDPVIFSSGWIDSSKYRDDMRILPTSFSFPGSHDPTEVLYNLTAAPGGGSSQKDRGYEFESTDSGFYGTQVPEDYIEGDTLWAHVHWTPHSRGSAENGNTVGWFLTVNWANIDDTFPSIPQTANLLDTCTGVSYKHLMSQSTAIIGTGKTVSSMIRGVITRSGGTWSSSSSGELPILLEIDFHYYKRRLGKL